jgi:hypothetical protein
MSSCWIRRGLEEDGAPATLSRPPFDIGIKLTGAYRTIRWLIVVRVTEEPQASGEPGTECPGDLKAIAVDLPVWVQKSSFRVIFIFTGIKPQSV